MLKRLFNFVCPSTCLVCRLETNAHNLCDHCLEELSNRESNIHEASVPCRICSEESLSNLGDGGLCAACALFPPPYDSLISAWVYEGIPEKLIKAFKYQGRQTIAEYFAETLLEIITEHHRSSGKADHSWADLVLALPSSLERMRKRKFSHTHLIARCLARSLNVPLCHQGLEFLGKTQAQASMPMKERAANPKNHFHAIDNKVAGRRLILVDDVATSGASIYWASKALELAGAKEIAVVTLARSRSFSKNQLACRRRLAREETTETTKRQATQ